MDRARIRLLTVGAKDRWLLNLLAVTVAVLLVVLVSAQNQVSTCRVLGNHGTVVCREGFNLTALPASTCALLRLHSFAV